MTRRVSAHCMNRDCVRFHLGTRHVCPDCTQRRHFLKIGTADTSRRLTEDEKAEIRRRMSRFDRPVDIARDLGITVNTVRYTMRGAS